MKRMWINQPSTQQPFHSLHAINVLARKKPYSKNCTEVYFLSGSTWSMIVPTIVLSRGWLKEAKTVTDSAIDQLCSELAR